jgi:hypothetical protein
MSGLVVALVALWSRRIGWSPGKQEEATDTGGLRSSRASLTRHGWKSNGVHKNDTSCKPIIDTLAAGVRFIRAFRIDPCIELLPPLASFGADVIQARKRKGAITCAHTEPSSSP